MTCAHAQSIEAFNWSGFYVGGNIGVAEGRATTNASTSDSFPGSYFTPPDAPQIAQAADGHVSQSRATGGLFAGYGQQFNNVYLGIEASMNSLSFDETHSSSAVYQSNADAKFTNELSIKADQQIILRARLGWAQERWLAYIAGGVAATQIRLDASFSDDFLGTGAAGRDTSKETKGGWGVALGGEYALNEKWVIKGEYLYADYGKVDTSARVINPAFSGA